MTWTKFRLATCLLVFSFIGSLVGFFLVSSLGSLLGRQPALFAQQLSIPPAFPRPEQQHHLPGVDEPPVVVHGDRREVVSPAKLKEQADEIAKLAQSVPPDVAKVTGGQLPKDLVSRLKQIEKLSKQLRSEIAR